MEEAAQRWPTLAVVADGPRRVLWLTTAAMPGFTDFPKEDEGKTALTPVNGLSPAAIDPNAYTPEFKGFLVKIERA
jgi:hypothetical protein